MHHVGRDQGGRGAAPGGQETPGGGAHLRGGGPGAVHCVPGERGGQHPGLLAPSPAPGPGEHRHGDGEQVTRGLAVSQTLIRIVRTLR